MHQLSGMLDGSVSLHLHMCLRFMVPVNLILVMHITSKLINWYVLGCLLQLISKDTLSEVRDFSHSLQVWQRLESWFNMASLERALDLN